MHYSLGKYAHFKSNSFVTAESTTKMVATSSYPQPRLTYGTISLPGECNEAENEFLVQDRIHPAILHQCWQETLIIIDVSDKFLTCATHEGFLDWIVMHVLVLRVYECVLSKIFGIIQKSVCPEAWLYIVNCCLQQSCIVCRTARDHLL